MNFCNSRDIILPMQIIWHGQSCFQIIISQGKNSSVLLVIDPFSEEIGLRLPKLEANIVLVSHQHYGHNNVKAVSGSPFLVEGPGEYEIKNVFIQGIPSWHDSKEGQERGQNTIYTIKAEEMCLCHLGDLGQNELTEEQLEKIGEVDILMLPIGGAHTISSREAIKIRAQLEPKITIPMHYQIPLSIKQKFSRNLKLKIHPVKSSQGEVFAKGEQFNRVELDGLDEFLKPLGIKAIEPMNKLSLKKKEISAEEEKIVVLKP